jgi:hypothetical protein
MPQSSEMLTYNLGKLDWFLMMGSPATFVSSFMTVELLSYLPFST